MGGPAVAHRMQRSARLRFSGPSAGCNLRCSASAAARRSPSAVSAGSLPSAGSTINDVRKRFHNMRSAIPPSFVIGEPYVLRDVGPAPVHISVFHHSLFVSRRFGWREGCRRRQLRGPLQRRDRCVGPYALQVRLAVGRARRCPGFLNRESLSGAHRRRQNTNQSAWQLHRITSQLPERAPRREFREPNNSPHGTHTRKSAQPTSSSEPSRTTASKKSAGSSTVKS